MLKVKSETESIFIDNFTRGFMYACLSTGGVTDPNNSSEDTPMTQHFNVDEGDDFAVTFTDEEIKRVFGDETILKIVQECEKFQEQTTSIMQELSLSEEISAGIDFLLTRNGHGAGFWDGDWSDDQEEKFMEVTNTFSQIDLYAGDDNKVWI